MRSGRCSSVTSPFVAAIVTGNAADCRRRLRRRLGRRGLPARAEEENRTAAMPPMQTVDHGASPFTRRRRSSRARAGLLTPGSSLPRPFPGHLPSGSCRVRSPVTVARPCRIPTGFPLRARTGYARRAVRPPKRPLGHVNLCAAESSAAERHPGADRRCRRAIRRLWDALPHAGTDQAHAGPPPPRTGRLRPRHDRRDPRRRH